MTLPASLRKPEAKIYTGLIPVASPRSLCDNRVMDMRPPAVGKAFALNQDRSVYGAFAEIGAGQETANHFFKAGLASQTVAKSMSAYDMTFSDEIYGRQSRYVSKDRLLTMLGHEYRLLQKRLKKTRGQKTRFFAFANTAVTGGVKKQVTHPHSWMGIRFQTRPGGPFNDIIFHVECRDDNRLRQYEALGVLGVNLIYACFYLVKDYKKLIASLTDHLHKPRIEINGFSFSGPDIKHFDSARINGELVRQGLSQTAFFNSKGQSEMIADAIFGKSLLIFYINKGEKRHLLKERELVLKKKPFKKSYLSLVFPSAGLLTENSLEKYIREFCKNDFGLLTARVSGVGAVGRLLRECYHNNQKTVFIIPRTYFVKQLFHSDGERERSALQMAGGLFDKKTFVQVGPPANRSTQTVKTHSFPQKEINFLRDYLVTARQLEDLY